MLLAFSVKNAFSFKEKQKISFSIDDRVPQDERFIYLKSPVIDKPISKVLTVLGHNASGKSNLLKALTIVLSFIRGSYFFECGQFPFIPFLFTRKHESSEFFLEFIHKDIIYEYALVVDLKKVLFESVKMRSKNAKSKMIFSRKYDFNKCEYINKLNKPVTKLGMELSGFCKENASIISTLQIKASEDYWNNVRTESRTGLEKIWDGISEFESNLIRNDDYYSLSRLKEAFDKNKKVIKKVIELATDLQLGLHSIDFQKLEETEYHKVVDKIKGLRSRYYSENSGMSDMLSDLQASYVKMGEEASRVIKGVHKVKNKKYYLPMHFESRGTRKILALLLSIATVLEKGGLAILDEVEANLHPLVVKYIVELFFSPERNPQNAQLICSTHNILILRLVDKNQVVLIEKNANGESEVFGINGHQRNTSLMEKYLAGVYGAVLTGY